MTGETRGTLTRSWRKVRGKRWKALRARLGQLRESAEAANEVLRVIEHPAAADLVSSEPNIAEQPPASEPRTLKH